MLEPLPWPGNPARPIDDTNLGKYFFEVRRPRHEPRRSTRAASPRIYGEWETTDEAKRDAPHLPRVAALPRARPARCRSSSRSATPTNAFREVWSTGRRSRRTRSSTAPLPPRRAAPGPCRRAATAAREGRPPAPRRRLHRGRDAASSSTRRAAPRRHPLRHLALQGAPAPTSTSGRSDRPRTRAGVSRPSDGIHRRSPLRRHLRRLRLRALRARPSTTARLRDVAAVAPYDVVEIVVNGRDLRRRRASSTSTRTVAADNALAPYVFVHEFGHHFAGLADEYYTSDVAYAQRGRARPSRGSRTSPPHPEPRRSGRTS